MDILLITTIAGLDSAVNAHEGARCMTVPASDWATRIIISDRPPQAIYADDTVLTPHEIATLIQLAESRRLPIAVNLVSTPSGVDDVATSGIAVISERDASKIATFIGRTFGLRARAGKRAATIALGGSKGGIGKSTITWLLAEGLRRRNLRTLIIDGDNSNSGIVPKFRIPSGFKTYAWLLDSGAGTAAFTAKAVRDIIYHHEPSGIDFLLGSEDATNPADLTTPTFDLLYRKAVEIDQHDVIFGDTGPDIKKRPYAVQMAMEGATLVLPCPPDPEDVAGAYNALMHAQSHGVLDRCRLLFMEAEKGSVFTSQNSDISALIAHFPTVPVLGTLPRAAHIISHAKQVRDAYITPYDIAPHSVLIRTCHAIVDALIAEHGLAAAPRPQSSLWQRLRGERVVMPPASTIAEMREVRS